VFPIGDAATQRSLEGTLQTPRRTTNAQDLHTVTGFHNNGTYDSHARQGPPPPLPSPPSLSKPSFPLCVLCGETSSVFANGDAATQRSLEGTLQTPRCTTNAQGLHTVTGFHNDGSNDSHA
jgi:hypothetical protein